MLVDGSGHASDKTARSVVIFGSQKLAFMKEKPGNAFMLLNPAIKVARIVRKAVVRLRLAERFRQHLSGAAQGGVAGAKSQGSVCPRQAVGARLQVRGAASVPQLAAAAHHG